MSSSIDDVECPNCGGTARREQYTESDDINIDCPECGWNNEHGVENEQKVTITWCWEDMRSFKPHWTPKRCQKALSLISKRLRDRSIELGHEVIEVLLDDYSGEIGEEITECDICKAKVCFERHNEDMPPEYDVCSKCDNHICSNCNISKNEDPLCKQCGEKSE